MSHIKNQNTDQLIKKKPGQSYEWYQDTNTVKIKMPINGVTMKKIDIFVSDLILKINI